MVDRLTSVQNQVRVLEKINQELDEELNKYIQKSTAQGVIISTHNVGIGQQEIHIKKLQAGLSEALDTIENLIGKKEATPTDMSAIYREKYPSVFQPVPYPYTNPVRDIIIFKKGKK